VRFRQMNKSDAALHPSAEGYRTRANLIRRSIGPKTNAEQRDMLMELARADGASLGSFFVGGLPIRFMKEFVNDGPVALANAVAVRDRREGDLSKAGCGYYGTPAVEFVQMGRSIGCGKRPFG